MNGVPKIKLIISAVRIAPPARKVRYLNKLNTAIDSCSGYNR
jgi:hypothetical protein